MPGLLVVLAVLASPAASPSHTDRLGVRISEASRAIDSGRLEQARLMVAELVKEGASQDRVDPLLADLAFASGDDATALTAYSALLKNAPKDSRSCERAMIAALRLNRVEEAKAFSSCATDVASPSWRAWNAYAVLADLRSDWEAADDGYEAAAAALGGRNATVLNNMGYSRLLRGDWAASITYFEEALKLEPGNARIANNLELARAAIDENLPRRRAGESSADWAARLNDAGVAAALMGDRSKAIAAFTQALERSDTWFPRAANNLDTISSR